MNRQKEIKRPALAKLEAFVNQVYLNIGSNKKFNTRDLCKEYGISNNYATLLLSLKVLSGKNETGLFWTWQTPPSKSLSLLLIEKARVYENYPKSKKMTTKKTEKDLFNASKVDQDLLKIVCAIASASYGATLAFSGENYPVVNTQIIAAAKDLLNKLKENGN